MASRKPEKETTARPDKELRKPPDGWTRCHAYLERKGRFCRQTVVESLDNDAGARYCGNHVHLHQRQGKRKRIPCPVDSSHSIYEDVVAKHILVCPRTKRRRNQEQEPYYRHNINLGGYGGLKEENMEKDLNVEWAERLALRTLQAYQSVFGPSIGETPTLTFEQLQKAIPLMDLSKPELDAGLTESVEAYRIKSGGYRHLVQQASLVGHLRRVGALPDLGSITVPEAKVEKTCLLDLGAGRGMFGLVAAGSAAASKAFPDLQLVLLERAGTRGKAETVLRNAQDRVDEHSSGNYLALKEFRWTRKSCDLAHVHMPTVLSHLQHNDKDTLSSETPGSASYRLVVVAKHLCGAGTDIALRSLQDVASQVDACLMATCCHGICTWDEYVGRDFLARVMQQETDENSFGRKEFDLMRRWTSGTVASPCVTEGKIPAGSTRDKSSEAGDQEEEGLEHCAAAPENVKDSFSASSIVHRLGLTCGVQGLGRACQRLFDYGRCEYMRDVLFVERSSAKSEKRHKVEIVHYVDISVTPQNAALMAYRE